VEEAHIFAVPGARSERDGNKATKEAIWLIDTHAHSIVIRRRGRIRFLGEKKGQPQKSFSWNRLREEATSPSAGCYLPLIVLGDEPRPGLP
jgi:hypothetical protein